MWGESSKNCENNCQCSGLITDSFKINSGNGTTKRKQEEAFKTNFKTKMNPYALDFKSPSPITPKRRVLGEIQNSVSPLFRPKVSPVIERLMNSPSEKKSPLIDKSSPLTTRQSPLTARQLVKRTTTKISRMFEERTKFKMSNKENEATVISETFNKFTMEEETRDCNFQASMFRESSYSNWSATKLDFTDALQTKTFEITTTKESVKDLYVPEKDIGTDLDTDFETLHDLEEEFDSDNFDQCTKYEIISTDSPNIISRGRASSSRKVTARNFDFGAPLAESEQSTSFNRPNPSATRMLNFEDEDFEFTSPAAKSTRPSTSFSVKKSLKFSETPTKSLKFETPTKTPTKSLFSETPTKIPLRHEQSDSSIGSMSSIASSPSSQRLFTSESTTSMESGFMSELEEPFLDIDEASNSPKMPNFDELLSGKIKNNIIRKDFLKRPSLQRSLSFNPDPRKVLSPFNESPEVKKSQKRPESPSGCLSSSKKRKNSEDKENVEKVPKRPILQRCFSENHASIMSALARSATEPDLIGDFSVPYALPLTSGDHTDLKSISCDTLAALFRGDYASTVHEFKVIDCRYPYEFEGGHIPGALNLYTPSQVRELLDIPQPADKRSILIFHCEFSLERGPKLYRYLRSSDRSKNMENYPSLNYPEIYLLHQGYHAFYQNYPELCANGYTAMKDPKHTHMLRKHRSIEEPTSFFTHHRKPGHKLMY